LLALANEIFNRRFLFSVDVYSKAVFPSSCEAFFKEKCQSIKHKQISFLYLFWSKLSTPTSKTTQHPLYGKSDGTGVGKTLLPSGGVSGVSSPARNKT